MQKAKQFSVIGSVLVPTEAWYDRFFSFFPGAGVGGEWGVLLFWHSSTIDSNVLK